MRCLLCVTESAYEQEAGAGNRTGDVMTGSENTGDVTTPSARLAVCTFCVNTGTMLLLRVYNMYVVCTCT